MAAANSSGSIVLFVDAVCTVDMDGMRSISDRRDRELRSRSEGVLLPPLMWICAFGAALWAAARWASGESRKVDSRAGGERSWLLSSDGEASSAAMMK